MAIKTIPEKKICTICGNEIGKGCDGMEYICLACGYITCTGEQVKDYSFYVNRTVPVSKDGKLLVHLYIRGHGQHWDCGPLVENTGRYTIKNRNCDEPGYFEYREKVMIEHGLEFLLRPLKKELAGRITGEALTTGLLGSRFLEKKER